MHSLESLQQECFAESHSEAAAVAIAEHMKTLLVRAEPCSRRTLAEFPAGGRDVLSPGTGRGLAGLEVKAVILAHSSSLEQPHGVPRVLSQRRALASSCCPLPQQMDGRKLEDGKETGI